MPISPYLILDPGASFDPDAVANMGKAFEDAVVVLGIRPRDETKRAAVARFIIQLAEIDGGCHSPKSMRPSESCLDELRGAPLARPIPK